MLCLKAVSPTDQLTASRESTAVRKGVVNMVQAEMKGNITMTGVVNPSGGEIHNQGTEPYDSLQRINKLDS